MTRSQAQTTDPVEGGLDTNDYAYVKDPINEFDLDGNGFWLFRDEWGVRG